MERNKFGGVFAARAVATRLRFAALLPSNFRSSLKDTAARPTSCASVAKSSSSSVYSSLTIDLRVRVPSAAAALHPLFLWKGKTKTNEASDGFVSVGKMLVASSGEVKPRGWAIKSLTRQCVAVN